MTAGSFTVNGVAIDVASGDTVNGVPTKIDASDAGVTATYDDETQTIRLTSRATTSGPIIVAGDTSGFLAAVKLDGTAASTPGSATRSALDAPLREVAAYAGVSAGTLIVNGQAIAIDPATSSGRALVASLDGIEHLQASLDDTTGDVMIAGSRPGDAVSLTDTSGGLAALGIASGTHRGAPSGAYATETRIGATYESNAGRTAERLTAAVVLLNDAVARWTAPPGGATLGATVLRERLDQLVAGITDAGIAGVRLETSATTPALRVDRVPLVQALDALLAGDTTVPVSTSAAIDDLVNAMARLPIPAPTA